MDDLKKHSSALILICILALLKFVIFPIIEWQDKQIIEQSLMAKKLNKVEQLLSEKGALSLHNETLQERISRANALFFPYEEEDSFKLKKQKEVESVINDLGMSIKSIGWITVVEERSAPLTHFQMEFNVTGKSEQVINYLTSLSTQNEFVDTISLNIALKRQKPGRIGTMSTRLRLAFYMRRPE